MTIAQFNQAIERRVNNMPQELLDISKRRMMDAKRDIERRIKTSGINADGQPFPPYTPAYQQFKTDVGLFRGHVDLTLGTPSINKRISAVEKRKKRRNKIAKAFKQKGRATLSADEIKALKKARRAKQIPRGPELWSNINIKHEEASPFLVSVTVAPLDETNVKKSEGLAKKRGNFLKPNPEEAAALINGINEDFIELLNF